MKNAHKGFAPLLILVIIAILIIGAGAYISSKDSTEAPEGVNGDSKVIVTLPATTTSIINPKPIPSPTPTPTPTPVPSPITNQCDVNPDVNGKCPAGCVNYGNPLGCVPQEYDNDCNQNPGKCPVCLASNTMIDTPSGKVAVKDLQIGMSIWTINKVGRRVTAIVTKTSKVPAPPTHHMVDLVLSDGRELFASPGHPTVNGRSVGDLAEGDIYDGASIVSVQRVSYSDGATYDVLPSGETGFYWANGVLLGSTLR